MGGLRTALGAARLRVLGSWMATLGLAAFAALALVGLAGGPAAGQLDGEQARRQARGPELFQRHCAHCHGVEGRGTFRGPTLVGVGAATADFYLRSGRMPIDNPQAEVRRRDPQFSDEQVRELVDYVASLGAGPAIPEVDLLDTDLARGGELFRLHCASCHNWDGKGGALVNRQNAPELHGVPPTQVAEAIRVGPGAMPVFGEDVLTDSEVDDIVAYVDYLEQPRDRGGYGLAHWGPATEAVAGFIALGGLLLLTGWLGERATRSHESLK